MSLSTNLISVGVVIDQRRPRLLTWLHEVSDYLAAHFSAYELLVVDNTVHHDTELLPPPELTALANLRLIRLSRRYALDTAVLALVDQTIGDYVVLIEAGQDPVLITRLLEAALNGNDIVVSRRNLAAHYSWFDRSVGALLYRAAGRLLGMTIDPQDGFSRAFSRRAVNALTKVRSRRRHLRVLGPSIGFRRTTVAVDDSAGSPRYSRLTKLAELLDLTISTSVAPLRLAALLGVLASLLSAAYLAYIVVVTIVRGGELAEGWLTSSLTTTTLFLLLFVMLSILAEYIGRLLEEVKDEPLYFIESEHQSPITVVSRLLEDEELNVVRS